MSCNSNEFSKKEDAIKPFKIQVEKNEKGIKLKCLEGCAWIDLTFDKNNYQPQTVNEFGMVNPDGKQPISDSSLADFLFTISKTEDGIELIGKEGTAWKELKFKLNNYQPQLIDQMGMSK